MMKKLFLRYITNILKMYMKTCNDEKQNFDELTAFSKKSIFNRCTFLIIDSRA